MYAIVEIAGQQYKVAKDQKIYVNRLAEDEGASLNFDKVLLTDDSGNVTLGAPAIDGAQVGAKVLRHLRGDKVIVFKKKRRKGYKKKNGHRQWLTQLEIGDISLPGSKKSSQESSSKASSKENKEDKTASASSDQSGANIDKILNSVGKASADNADDLKKVNGIGPAYEKKLNEVGIFTYEQISKLTADDRDELAKVNGLSRDKMEADQWVEQAKELLK